MIRSIIACATAGCVLIVQCLACPPAAAAPTGQVTITGNVPTVCSLDVQQEPGAVSIPDISAGHTNRRVATVTRSEEHTSELQSLAYLVCRLLLEKKKKTN